MLKRSRSFIKKYLKKGSTVYSILNRIDKINRHTLPCVYSFIRVQSPVMKLFGPLYPRSRKIIALDITYRCHVGCLNCNRSVGKGQAPTNEEMTVEQIQRFVQESVDKKVKWGSIHVVGGEPTLHPQLFEILEVLIQYKQHYSPDTKIDIYTSGYGEKVMSILSQVPNEIAIVNSSKESKVQLHYPFNMAPKDSLLYKYADYANGCWIGSNCGMGLTPYGYYACSLAGGIDRIFGLNKGKKTLPSPTDPMLDDLRPFCQLCGHFRCASFTYKSPMSQTWKVGYENYRKNRPNLSWY